MMLNGGKSHGKQQSAVARAAGGGCAGWTIGGWDKVARTRGQRTAEALAANSPRVGGLAPVWRQVDAQAQLEVL